jgi:hypothetical protein
LASLAIHLFLYSTGEKQAGKIRVGIKIDFGTSEKSETIVVQNGTTAFEALNSTVKVEYKEYAGMGKIITSIDGIASNNTYSWLYFVDDKLAMVSADKYLLTKDSSIIFKYLANEEALKYVS